MRGKVERAEGEVIRAEKEIEAETNTQDQELQEIKSSYQKLEKRVVSHLHALRNAIEVNQQQQRRNIHMNNNNHLNIA